jgi:hypothetical protein
VPAGMPTDVPAAASDPAPTLPEPSSAAWPFPSTFPQTSGTGRLAGGASLWTDFVYDAYGAADPLGLPDSTYDRSSNLAARKSTHFTISHLARGTEVLEGNRVVARASRQGVAAVRLASGRTVLTLVRPTRAHRVAPKRSSRPGARGRRTPLFTG